MKFPKYIKSNDGQIGTYAHLTFGNRPVYRFENGEYKLRQATDEELSNGSDKLSDLVEQEQFAMTWKQLFSRVWEAVGKYGKFRIECSRGKFWREKDMKNHNSAEYAVLLANGLSIAEMPFGNRSDRWWDLFWQYIGLDEAQRIKERV